MRKITDKERIVVDSIVAEVAKYGCNVISPEFLIVPLFEKHNAHYEKGSNLINVEYDGNKNICFSSNTELGNDLLFLYSVLALLEREGLIFYIDKNHTKNVVGNVVSDSFGHFELISYSLNDMLSHTFDYLYVTEDLVDFVKGNYMTYEEKTLIEAKKQTRNSMIQMWIGLSALIIALFSLLCQ